MELVNLLLKWKSLIKQKCGILIEYISQLSMLALWFVAYLRTEFIQSSQNGADTCQAFSFLDPSLYVFLAVCFHVS
jgi:hypothetical protein